MRNKNKKQQFLKTKLIWFLSLALVASLTANAFAQSPLPSSFLGSSLKDSQKIQKKVFAKALAQALNISPAKNSKCFKDLKKTDETSLFICGLKQAKVFTAVNSNKFLPNSQTDFGFAITSLCRAKNWDVKKNFKACTAYARSHGFLDSPLPKSIKSTSKITYKQLATFFDRALSASVGQTQNQNPQINNPQTDNKQPEENNNQPFNGTIPSQQNENISFSPVADATIDVNFFDNIKLTTAIPTRFYKDEIYFIEGEVVGKSADEAFAFLCPDKLSCDKSKNFLEKTVNNRFKIPIHFKETGNYQLGVIPGRSGTSKIQNISILPGEPETASVSEAPTGLATNYSAGKMTFSWIGEGSLIRLTVFQNDVRRDYLFRQKTNSFSPSSKDFNEFKKGSAGWQVKIAGTASDTKEIDLTTQDFYKVKTEAVQIKQLKETYPSPAKFVFQAKALSPVSKKAALILPNGQVKEVNFAANDVSAQSDFTIEADFDSTGTYIFEVNDPEGGAVVNVPVFIGGNVPLLPDYFAMHEETLNVSPISSLNAEREKLLNLVNKDRAKYSLPAVVLDPALNSIAQAHSQDMKDRNFFAHVNPSGLAPDDRRKNAGYTTAIRENLGKAATLELVEEGLMRSPVHRSAIIDPTMTRVGIGIVKDTEGYFLTTQNFSSDPITESQLSSIADELFNYTNSLRAQNSLPNFSHDQTLKEVATEWSGLMSSGNFFAVTDPSNGQKLVDLLRARNINTSIQMYIVKASQKDQLKEEILAQDTATSPSDNKIGIGLTINNIGEIFMTVVYTP